MTCPVCGAPVNDEGCVIEISHDSQEDPMNEIIDRLARLLVLRQIDLHNAERPIDRKTCAARLEGAADAVHRVVNAYGPEQVLTAVRESVTHGQRSVPGGYRAWLDERCSIVAEKLRLIERDERGS